MSTIHRVLIVEDDSRVRAALTDLLAATNDFVVTAAVGTAADAHTVLATAPVDRILMDVHLPNSDDGITLIRALSRRYPVIALSIDGTNRTSALRAGAPRIWEGRQPEGILQAVAKELSRERMLLMFVNRSGSRRSGSGARGRGKRLTHRLISLLLSPAAVRRAA